MDQTRAQTSRAAELGRLRRELLRKIVASEVRRRRAQCVVEERGETSSRWPSEPAEHAVLCVN